VVNIKRRHVGDRKALISPLVVDAASAQAPALVLLHRVGMSPRRYANA